MDTLAKRRRGRPRAFQMPAEAGAAVQSLDRGLRVLAVVADKDGLSLSEVAAAAQMAPATVYRMLMTLEGHGMVEFDRAAQLWSVGVGAYRVGSAFLRGRKLVDRARAVMQELVEQTGETANLGVADDDSVVFVSQVETHQAIRAFFRPGTRSPLHASGIGKAILAHLPAERVRTVIERTGLEAFTAHTLADRSALAADLAVCRERGYAVDDEERFPGMRCIGAPVFNEFAEPIAGVSISGPTVRLTPERLDELGPLIATAAAEVTRIIGGRAPD
jgi:IclR family acetate operon transcriptional repressor